MTDTRSTMSTLLTRMFSVAILVALFGTTLAFGQEYKEAYNAGLEAYKASNMTLALTKFEEAASGADAASDASVANMARKAIGTIRYNQGVNSLKAENFDAALTQFENGINTYPTFAKNYLGRAQVLLKQNKFDDAISAFVQTVQVAEENADSQTARSASNSIRSQYVFRASSALARNGNRPRPADADEAIENLEALQQYVDADSDVHYYLAESYKVKGDFDTAIQHADQALEMSSGSATAKAKIFYVKGEALMSKGENSAAIAAFQNALYGSYRSSAQHYIETLGT